MDEFQTNRTQLQSFLSFRAKRGIPFQPATSGIERRSDATNPSLRGLGFESNNEEEQALRKFAEEVE
jgi:hypothetical protein